MTAQPVDHLTLDLDDSGPPESHLEAIVGALGGAWEIEGAHATWRARQTIEERTYEVGLGRMGPDTPWLLAWRVDPEIPDRYAFGGLGLALLAAFVAAATGVSLGAGLWTLIASALGLLGTLQIARWVIQARLPDTDDDRRALGERLKAALAGLPNARILEG